MSTNPPSSDGTPPSRIKAPRLYHKKSRNGCERCRARRVKCSEEKPTCAGCSRHGVPCVYEDRAWIPPRGGRPRKIAAKQEDVIASSRSSIRNRIVSSYEIESSAASEVKLTLQNTDVVEIPESETRRILELRLLHHFIIHIVPTFPAAHILSVKDVWAQDVPRMACEYQNLLHAILAFTALHLSRSEPANTHEMMDAYHRYLGLTLQEHRKAVGELSAKIAEFVCFTSVMVLKLAFAVVQDRALEPYSPPMEWLQMAQGAGFIFSTAWGWIEKEKEDNLPIITISSAPPSFMGAMPQLFSEENRRHLLGLLSPNIPDASGEEEEMDEVTRDAYEKSLSYVGAMQIAIDDGEVEMCTYRRVLIFGMLVPSRFIELVEEMRPRALLILARFFALTAKTGNTWWVGGKTLEREIYAIQKVLPAACQPYLQESLEIIKSMDTPGMLHDQNTSVQTS